MNAVELAVALERARQTAMVRADFETLEAMLDDDVAYVHSNGVEDSKTRYLSDLKSGAVVYQSLSFEDVSVRAATRELIVLTGWMIASIRKASGEISVRSRYTAVWEQRDTTWRLVIFQGTKATT